MQRIYWARDNMKVDSYKTQSAQFFGALCVFGVLSILMFLLPKPAQAATTIPFVVNLSESVTVTGTPRIAVNVGGVTRYADYTSGTGTSALTFTYAMVAGDIDLDGVTLVSPIELNGGTIRDIGGNDTSLSFTVPNTSNVKVNYPSLGMDFLADADGRYTLNGTVYNNMTSLLGATGGSFTRSSTATYYNSAGVLQIAPINTPRFDHDPITLLPKGLLIEEGRTNYVKNSEFNGGAVGVTPNNFVFSGGGAGVSASITGAGTLNGERYLEIRFFGTSSAAGVSFPNLFFTPVFADLVPAAIGQTWTGRVHIISETGTSPNSFQIQIAELSSANVFLNATNLSISPGNYQTVTRTLTSASTAYIRFIILTTMNPGQSIDKTIRFSVPQLEFASFPTSYIPTTTGTVTRSMDNLDIALGSWLNNTNGTFFINAQKPYAQGVPSRFYSLIGGLGQVSLINDQVGTNITGYVTDAAGTAVIGLTGSGLTVGTPFKSALTYANNDFAQSTNGAAVTTDTSGTFPAFTNFTLGNNASGGPRPINTPISIFKYYPARVANAQLQLMTQ
jgi:hypothetical protein